MDLFDGAGEKRSVFSTWPRANARALRNGPDKLIERLWTRDGELERWELYALDRDGGEQVNRLATPTPQDRQDFERLREELNVIRTTSENYRSALTLGTAVELDPEEKAALQALGYLK